MIDDDCGTSPSREVEGRLSKILEFLMFGAWCVWICLIRRNRIPVATAQAAHSALRTPQVQSAGRNGIKLCTTNSPHLLHWAVVLETYVQGYEEQERHSNTPEAASQVAFLPRMIGLSRTGFSWVPKSSKVEPPINSSWVQCPETFQLPRWPTLEKLKR